MARQVYVVFFVISHLSLLSMADEEKRFHPKCPFFYDCGRLQRIRFPFTNRSHPECGLLMLDNCNETFQKVQLGKDGPWFNISSISQDDTMTLHEQVRMVDDQVQPDNHSCEYFKNLTVNSYPFLSFGVQQNQNVFRCPANHSIPQNLNSSCNDSKLSILYPDTHSHIKLPTAPAHCSEVRVVQKKAEKGVQFLNLYTGWFHLQVHVADECDECHYLGGRCQSDSNGRFHCSKAKSGNGRLKLGLGLGLGASAVLLVVLSLCIIGYRKRKKYTSTDPIPESELQVGSIYFGVPIFSYCELAEATNNFIHENKLGVGGFGTVYYGKPRDGRKVAVKRLYEHSYRRVKQFMNEVEILTHLRHQNLVSLYGCTLHRSQQGLLLVYEYVPNGAVADHLHGDRLGSLTWHVRMKIAIETATALAYLHASDIIHRDVKTNNILLDNNFRVKVADFGLSRLFPTDVTHVSTAPQGSPGYVDPEYHLCYQLTDKSDVYSFGVVLIELISSMPAVDMSRNRQEINLANLAVNRIQERAIEELFDPSLGYQSDEEVKRMITSVAELAFLCLQQIKEMRPSMDVVLEELKRIESAESKIENLKEEKEDTNDALKNMQPQPSTPDCDNVVLLKCIKVPS